MTLSVYNTLTRSKSAFQTIEEHKVRMYCCGITVYDYCHLGHARTCLVWDVVRRYLQWSGYEVNYIQNFTDIDNKILKRASQDDHFPKETPKQVRLPLQLSRGQNRRDTVSYFLWHPHLLYR